ncbi:uncharacterized protein TM35_000042860 [Trypanosoma theileri]|uniref:Uncharacterized protein n=1 Tax=Trypanosoma theileri TaxID=67003 RepID=A0A1X0P567_9TRYP|nr:uncharacterized protein TM35_000042860 [Trypanosoma theileri]ORC92072.1 hypothetical protein TM35_000042860 [Trypanosoma theileri]
MAARSVAFQADILEWLVGNKKPLRVLRKERYALEKGFIAYFNDFRDMMREIRGKESKETQVVKEKKDDSAGSQSLSQFYESEELAKRMKWKRVTWDDDADYTSFSRRILDNDNLLKNVSAFSFLSIHVTKDPSSTEVMNFPSREKNVELGTLTNWVLQERDPIIVEKYKSSRTKAVGGAFTVDWTAGVVKIMDSASIQEILTFLHTVAPRLQALQVRMEEQQTKLVEDVQNVKIRVGAEVKFNDHDTTFWDDPKRKSTPDYVSPDDVQQFLQSMLKSAFLYRWFLKGHGLRILPPGRPYFVDMEKKEVQIPANFADYNWFGAHQRFESIERFFSTMRSLWWMWFSLAMIIVGDVELL